MDVTLFIVYLSLYVFIIYYWMTFFNVLTFKTKYEYIYIVGLTLYFVSFGYEIFYSAFILDEYYKIRNDDELGKRLTRVWIGTLGMETTRLILFTFYRIFNMSKMLDNLFRFILSLHSFLVGVIPITAIVYLTESISLVDEKDKMLALIATYIISIIGAIGSIQWAYSIIYSGKK